MGVEYAESSGVTYAGDGKYGLYGAIEATAIGRADDAGLLDACGGQFGVTPDSGGVEVYHYHVQAKMPFTFGCFGPGADGRRVTDEECCALYEVTI